MGREAAYVTAAVLCWLALIWSLHQGLKQHDLQHMHNVIFARRLLLLFALTITFRIRAVHAFLTAVTGINNLALLLSYGAAMVAVYNIVRNLQMRLLANKGFFWLRRLFRLTLLIMAVGFPQVAMSPDLYHPNAAISLPIFLFRQLFYLYATSVCVVAVAGFQHMQHTDLAYPSRLRWMTAKVGMITAVFYCLIRLIETNLHWWGLIPADGTTAQVLQLYRPITFVAAALLWSLFFAGGLLFQALDRLATYWDTMQTVRALNVVTAEADIFGLHPVLIEQPVWWLCWRNGVFHIHCSVTYLMDVSRWLAARLHPEPGQTGVEPITDNRQRAEKLYALLHAVECEQQTDYPCLIKTYRQIGTQYQKGQFNE